MYSFKILVENVRDYIADWEDPFYEDNLIARAARIEALSEKQKNLDNYGITLEEILNRRKSIEELK